MGLRNNQIRTEGVRWISGLGNNLPQFSKHGLWSISNAIAFGSYTSVPQGYNSINALAMPIKTGGLIAAILKADSTFENTAILGIGSMESTLNGNSTVTANANMLSNIYATLNGEANASFGLTANGLMSVVIDVGARPSAFDIAQEVWQSVAAMYNTPGTMGEKVNALGDPWASLIEGTITAKQALQIMLSIQAGKTNIVDNGNGTATVTFRNTLDTIDRVEAEMNGSKRTHITFNV